MKEKEIWDKLDSLYSNKKSKGFVEHLIKSYIIPENNSIIQENILLGKFRCGLSNLSLISLDEVYFEIKDDSNKTNQMIDFVNNIFDEEPLPLPKLKIFNRKSLAIEGNKTDTVLRYETYLVLCKWVSDKFINGDKNIIYILNRLCNENGYYIKKVNSDNIEKIIFIKTKLNSNIKLGDLTNLHEIKALMVNKERKK